jgi:hypothetical protein
MKRGADQRWLREAIDNGEGILRLAPTWVPRVFMVPGRRLRLDPRDLYCLGMKRGGIDERWFASTTAADNGPGTPPDEGLSYIVWREKRITLKEAVDREGETLLGKNIFKKYGRWAVYAKFFDNMGPIPHHLHQMSKHAKNVGCESKPEGYYFPPEFNPYDGNFPYTFFGLLPGTTKDQVKQCLQLWEKGDNRILHLTQAYALERDTGWLLPPGILHAPGSFCTFEVQWASDVVSCFQNLVEGRYCDRHMLVKDVPPDKAHDFDYLVDMLDWEANVDPQFFAHHFLRPVLARGGCDEKFAEYWVVYRRIGGQNLFSAKRLIVQPGGLCTLKDGGAYGVYVTNGRGMMGPVAISVGSMIRYGELPEDEIFVSHSAATRGVTVKNTGELPLTLLKFFGPDSSPDMPV